MIERDVSPEHQAPIVWLQNLAHFVQVLKVYGADAARLCRFTTLALAQLERFVFADVKKLSGKEFVQLAIPVGY